MGNQGILAGGQPLLLYGLLEPNGRHLRKGLLKETHDSKRVGHLRLLKQVPPTGVVH